jgi:tripartite-type tricarboxylate transporter receptor subunit TctC
MTLPPRRVPHPAAGIAALCCLLLCGGAPGQTPRATSVIVPFPAGGGTDVVARLLAGQIGQSGGPTMVIENRPGAGTVIGTEVVARATPDGGTLLITAPSILVNPHLRKLSYDPFVSFEAICRLITFPLFVVVHNASPYRTLADLIQAARTDPGKLTIAGVGPATSLHVSVESFKRAAGVNLAYIPFPGDAPAVNALLGQHVDSIVVPYATVVQQVKAGALRALATFSPKRVDGLTAIPTVIEAGHPFQTEPWYALFAPAGTPGNTVADLAGKFRTALQAGDVAAKLVSQGLFPSGICGDAFKALLRAEFDELGRAIRDAGIKVE